jgi:hypothetical protein
MAPPNNTVGIGVQMEVCDGASIQQWSRAGNATLELRLGSDPKMCLEVAGSGNGSPVRINLCSGQIGQQWFYDDKEMLRAGIAPNRCMAIPPSQPGVGGGVIIYDCLDTAANYKWYTGLAP